MKQKIKKVLLFIPPVFTSTAVLDVNPLPPLGLAYLAAVLEQRGIEVKIYDSLVEGWHKRVQVKDNLVRIGSSFEEIETIIKDFKPDIVGVNNLFTTQRENAHEVYKIAKKINKDTITIAGGAHPTVMPELVLEDTNVDFVVLGEGEESFPELIEVLEGKRDVSTLDGVGYRQNDNIKILPKTRFIEDLDTLPFPARHLLNMEKYFGLEVSHGTRAKIRFSPIITSRGCPAKCTFCTAYKVWGRKFRSRSPENVVAELKHLKEQYGIEEIMFEDDNVTLNAKRAEKIFDLMIEENLGFVWDTPNGVATWTLTEELIYKMKKSGCSKLNFPIETGNEYVMKNIIKKPVKLEKVKPLVDYARSIDLDVGLFLVVGMPGETEDQIWDSYRLAEKLEIYFPHVSVATPYPGSELYDICRKNKYISDDLSLDDLFIRSFSVSTEHMSSQRLEEVFVEGQKYLFRAYLKRHPIEFSRLFIRKLFTRPGRVSKRVWKYITNKGDWGILK